MAVLSLAALGVVFGDIGTSPLYTLKTVLDVTGGAHSEPAAILGALSLILWTLIIVTSLKYVTFALRAEFRSDEFWRMVKAVQNGALW